MCRPRSPDAAWDIQLFVHLLDAGDQRVGGWLQTQEGSDLAVAFFRFRILGVKLDDLWQVHRVGAAVYDVSAAVGAPVLCAIE